MSMTCLPILVSQSDFVCCSALQRMTEHLPSSPIEEFCRSSQKLAGHCGNWRHLHCLLILEEQMESSERHC